MVSLHSGYLARLNIHITSSAEDCFSLDYVSPHLMYFVLSLGNPTLALTSCKQHTLIQVDGGGKPRPELPVNI